MSDHGGLVHVSFEGSPRVYDFVASNAFVTGIIGPVGSGKSYGGSLKTMRHASEQRPSLNGYRRTRVAIIRNTYGELKSTTIKTWLETFRGRAVPPVKYGASPITQNIMIPPVNFRWVNIVDGRYEGTPGLDLEVLFLALDREQDIAKLKSLDLSFAWLNEASELPKAIIDMITARVGRFPGEEDGWATWSGVFFDTNAADEMTWTEQMEGGDAPEVEVTLPDGTVVNADCEIIRQPAAMLEVGNDLKIAEKGHHRMGEEVPLEQCIHAAGRFWIVNDKPDGSGQGAAENLGNLKPGYYQRLTSNKTLEWLQRYGQAKRIYLAPGKPWVPEFNQNTMVRPLTFDPRLALMLGIDAGGGTLNPAAIWGQVGQFGDWRILRELVIADIGIDRFMDALLRDHAQHFNNAEITAAFVDPAAQKPDEVYKVIVGDHMRSKGLPVRYAPSNDPDVRREALALPMGRLVPLPNGEAVPGFLVDPSCTMLIAGLAGRWCRQAIKGSDGKRHAERPIKNEWSHPGDGCSYLTLGGGEHRVLKRGAQPGHGSRPSQGWANQGQPLRIEFDHSGLFD